MFREYFHKLIWPLCLIAALFILQSGSGVLAQSGSVQLMPASDKASNAGEGQPNNEVCFTNTVSVDYVGGPMCLSSQGGGCSPFAIDDAVRIFDATTGEKLLDIASYTNDVTPMDFSSKLKLGDNTLRVEIVDLLGPRCGGSALYLVPQASSPPPGETCPPVGIDIAINPPLRFPYDEIHAMYKVANEFFYEISGSRCDDPIVTVNWDGSAFTLHSPNGEVEVNREGQLDGGSFSVNRTGPSFDYGFSTAPTTDGGSPETGYFGGFGLNQSFVEDPSYFSLSHQQSIRRVYVPKLPSFKYAPAIREIHIEVIIITIVMAIVAYITIQTGIAPAAVILILLVGTVSGISGQGTGVKFITSSTIKAPEIAITQQVDNTTQFVDNAVVQSLYTAYGPLIDWSSLDVLVPSRTVVSAFTQFTFDGTGFSPNGQVLVSFDLPGNAELLVQVVTADAAGHIQGAFEMPPPDQVPLGTYLLSAVDYQSLHNSLALMGSEGLIPETITRIAGAHIEVVEDVTPPVTTATITCSLDMSGVCQSVPSVKLVADDDLSGVGQTAYSFDGGITWLPYTEPFDLVENGLREFVYRSIDKVGNTEAPVSSGPILIQRYIVLADSLLNVDEATNLHTQGYSHSNSNASITESVTIAFDILHYKGSFTQSGNVSLTFNELAQVIESVQLPLYPLGFYRERCTYVSGPLVINDTSPVYNTCLYVGGNVELRTTGARGKLTVVSEGAILDKSTNANLQAWDTTNGILFYARKGYTNISTGANYTGVIYSPFSTIGGEFTNHTFNGGLFAKTVHIGGGTGLNAQQAPGFPASTFTLPIEIPEPTSPTYLYLSVTSNGTVGGVSYGDEDILKYNLEADSWSLFIDGSDIGLGNTDIDAFDLQPDGSILLSFDSSTFSIPGLGTVEDRDIVRFFPTSTGNTTSGTFSWYFDGSDVGLNTSSEDIDAIGFAPDGKLILSTEGSFSVTGVSGEDEDLIAFTPSQLGATTSGTWSMYFDGSDVGLSNTSYEDIGGAWIDVSTGRIYLNTIGSFSVTGLSGDGADIFICTPGTLGATTTCTFGPGLYWDGSVNGFSGRVIDGLAVIK